MDCANNSPGSPEQTQQSASQLGDPRVEDISHCIVHGVLWQAFECDQPSVVLIDEIDKADIEFL